MGKHEQHTPGPKALEPSPKVAFPPDQLKIVEAVKAALKQPHPSEAAFFDDFVQHCEAKKRTIERDYGPTLREKFEGFAKSERAKNPEIIAAEGLALITATILRESAKIETGNVAQVADASEQSVKGAANAASNDPLADADAQARLSDDHDDDMSDFLHNGVAQDLAQDHQVSAPSADEADKTQVPESGPTEAPEHAADAGPSASTNPGAADNADKAAPAGETASRREVHKAEAEGFEKGLNQRDKEQVAEAERRLARERQEQEAEAERRMKEMRQQGNNQGEQQQGRPMSAIEYLIRSWGKGLEGRYAQKNGNVAERTGAPTETLNDWIARSVDFENRVQGLTEKVAALSALGDNAPPEQIAAAKKVVDEAADSVKRGFQNDVHDLMHAVNKGDVRQDAAEQLLALKQAKVAEALSQVVGPAAPGAGETPEAAKPSDAVEPPKDPAGDKPADEAKKEGVREYLAEMSKKLQEALKSMVQAFTAAIQAFVGNKKSAGPRPG